MRFSFPLLPLPAGDPLSPVPFVLGGICWLSCWRWSSGKSGVSHPSRLNSRPSRRILPRATSRKQAIFENAPRSALSADRGVFA